MIAWNGSRDATLAIHGALPLLHRVGKVSVLEGVMPANPFGAYQLPSLDLRAWLARRSIEAEFHAFKPDRDQGRAVLDAARAMDADLIAIGAWVHSRITELVLGGVTRHLFQNSDIPLLVAH